MHWLQISEELVHFLLSPIFMTINKAELLVLGDAARNCGMLRSAAACLKTDMYSSNNQVLRHTAA